MNSRWTPTTSPASTPVSSAAGTAGAGSGTPFDLRDPRRLVRPWSLRRSTAPGRRGVRPQLGAAGPYARHAAAAAALSHPGSGRLLECLTTEPGLQVYTGNHLDGSFHDRQRHPAVRHRGVALETQHFPDSPNRPDFPSPWLAPGEVYRSTTVYRLGLLQAG